MQTKNKKNKTAIIIISVILGLIIVFGLYFYNSFNGNFVSKMIAKNAATKYITEKYPNSDYYIEKVGYDFKFNAYGATAKSETKQDEHFQIYFDSFGKVKNDEYASCVLSGFNTWNRIDTEYRKLTDNMWGKLPYSSDIQFCTIEILEKSDDYTLNSGIGISMDVLEINKDYDIKELGKEHGKLVLYVQDNDVSLEKMVEILLEIKQISDENNVPFKVINFTLQSPENPAEKELYISNFAYEDIYKEGLMERIEENYKILKAYYDEIDGNIKR